MTDNNFVLPETIEVKDPHSSIIRISAAIRLASIQSSRLRKYPNSEKKREEESTPFLKHWHVLQAIASWPSSLTVSFNLLTQPEPGFPLSGKAEIAIVVTSTGSERELVVADLLNRCENLYALLSTFLDQAEFEFIIDKSEVKRWLKPLAPSSVFMIDRYRDSLALTFSTDKSKKKMSPVGFLAPVTQNHEKDANQTRLDFLFPWYQDSSSDLTNVLDALLFHRAPIWLHVRLRSAHAHPEETKELEYALTLCEELLNGAHTSESILSLQARALREAISDRIWQKGRQVFQGVCFLRAGPGNLDKPLSGKSATTTAQRWAQHGAENGKRNQTETFTGIQSKSSFGSYSWRQNSG